ncbi:MAG: hypothetical protein ACOYM5_14800 [Caulobacter sp.]
MEDISLTSRLADRFRWPIALIGGVSAMLAVADLASWIPQELTAYAAAAVGVPAAALFCCAAFDMKLQRAVSALNFERRAEARQQGLFVRLTGIGLPSGDGVLAAVAIVLLIVTLIAANFYHRAPATGLGFAGFFLVVIVRIALMARGQRTDRFMPPFS